MGIDRHEWEHRNYKSGRMAAVPAPLVDDETGQLAVDASLGETQPETPKAKVKAAPKESSKDKSKESSKESSKPSSKANAKTTSGGKRSGRAG